jgi:hypothetical protein
MIRLSDWETKLVSYASGLRHEPFAWGTHDCCTFAAGAVEAMTGVDPMLEYRGKYTTALGSARALGGKTLEEVLDEKFDQVPISHAQRGDLAFHNNCVGVNAGGYAWFVSDDGLARIYRSDWQKAWSVGRG